MTEIELVKLLRDNPDLRLPDSWGNGIEVQMVELQPIVKLSEHDMQCKVIAICQERAVTNPAYGLLYAVPNGQYRQGQRMEPGLRSGVPDLHLPIARHSRHGLYLELKIKPNKPSASQETWIRWLRSEGHAVEVVYDDPQAAIEILEWYIER